MRIIYYSGLSFIDHALPLVEALSKVAKVHLIIGAQRDYCRGTLVDVDTENFTGGVYKGKEFFRSSFPEGIYDLLERLEGFWVVFHPHRSFQHPGSWPMLWKETSFINSLKADILHLDGVSPSIARMIFRQKTPVVCTVHDAKPHSGEKNWRTTLWTRLTFPHVRHYIVHSNFSKDLLGKTYKIDAGKISAIPLGLLSVFKYWNTGRTVKEETKNILFFGRLSPYKGVEILIEAMKLLCRRLSGVKLVIAGEPMPWYEIPVIPRLGNNCQIEFVSRYITNAELCRLFQRACVCVLPYTDASQSGVALTSFAFNKPVVASNVGGMSEYVKDGRTGLLVPPNDPKNLAEALMSLLCNNDLRKKMAENIENGKTGIPTWDGIAGMLTGAYTTVLDCDYKKRRRIPVNSAAC